MKNIRLILTFDYELPLGGIAKSYRHSLFEPTGKLLDVLDTLKVPAVFFADIMSYIKLKGEGENNFVKPFENQLREIITRGYDVQLHLHPHWLESKLTDGKVIPSQKFKLGDFASDRSVFSIENIIAIGVKALTTICCSVNSEYKCIAYRAGGYNFVPHADRILKALYNNGIRYDSSISRGYFFRSESSQVDYRNIPDLPNWYLSPDGDFSKADSSGKSIYEVPIASKPKGLFEMPTSFKLKKYAYRAVENRGSMIHSNRKVNNVDKITQLFSSRMLTVDNHTFSPEYLIKILDYNVKRFSKHNNIILSLIGHPKSMDKYHYFLLTEFVRLAKNKYGTKLDFVTFKEVREK